MQSARRPHSIIALLVFICSVFVTGLSLPANPQLQTQTPNKNASIDSELAHWSAQLKSSNIEERREAARSLGHINSDDATQVLVAGLNDPAPIVRVAILLALGQRTASSVVASISALVTSDKDPFVRKAAAYALTHYSGSQRTGALTAALKDKDPEVRGAAAVALADHPDAEGISSLINATSDKSEFVRAQSARALGANGKTADEAVPVLIKLLTSDRESEVKRQAATALGSIGNRSALSALQKAARDDDFYLSQSAREAIIKIEETNH